MARKEISYGQADESAHLLLTATGVAFHPEESGKHDFEILPSQIASLTAAGAFGKAHKPDPSFTDETLHFSQKTKAGSSITLQITPADLLVLVKYLAQIGNRREKLGKRNEAISQCKNPWLARPGEAQQCTNF